MADEPLAIKMQPTMWAEQKPDVYGGQDFNQVTPCWSAYADGDMSGDSTAEIGLTARSFPPGTRVTVSEPLCPACQELREPIMPTPEAGPHYAGPCRCGFDWDKWVLDTYS